MVTLSNRKRTRNLTSLIDKNSFKWKVQ